MLCSLHAKVMLPTAMVHVKLNFLANVTLDVYTERDPSSSGSNFTVAVMVLSTTADKEPLTEGFLKPNRAPLARWTSLEAPRKGVILRLIAAQDATQRRQSDDVDFSRSATTVCGLLKQ